MVMVVVRCTECRGASRVDEPALGLAVQCPRCDRTFTAIEEAELIAPAPARADREARNETSSGRTDRSTAPLPEPPPPVFDFPTPPPPTPEPDFDPHREPQGQLPASVLIGLALLPFVVPILWLLIPALGGEPPVLSIVTPLALAVSVSILCLAVIYTVDWTPATRIKGVLVLVALSCFAGTSLYFLKKEMIDRMKRAFGQELEWKMYSLGGYEVKLPGTPMRRKDQPLALAKLDCFATRTESVLGTFKFLVGSGDPKPPRNPNDPELGTDDWFEKATKDIVELAGGELLSAVSVKHLDKFPGRELEIKIPDTGSNRVVRIFVVNKKVYYLSVEGPMLTADDGLASEVFRTFLVTDAVKG